MPTTPKSTTKTIYYTASTLDGFIADKHHSLDWLFQFGPAGEADYAAFIRDVGAIAMGSHTYEWLYRHHAAPDAPQPQPWPYVQPTWVFSTRMLPPVPNADLRFASGDVRPIHRDMIATSAGRNIWLVGGGDLVRQFHEHQLLDELIVTIAPVTLGAGMPLLPCTITTPPLQLIQARAEGRDFAVLHYRVRKSGQPPDAAHSAPPHPHPQSPAIR